MKAFLYRKFPQGFNEDIYIWDVDKTYLNTSFESLLGVLKIFIEFSIDKKSIAGSKELLVELRKGKGPGVGVHPIFFISASPLQLKKVLEGKFLLDGIQHDGIVLKDYRQLWKLHKNIPIKNNFVYKLTCLLRHRLNMPAHAKEILFGDDYERDPEVFSLYSDILAQRCDKEKLKAIFKQEGANELEVKTALNWVQENEKRSYPKDVVSKIFINMVKHRSLKGFAEQIIPTRNYAQTAAVLYEMAKISKEGFRRVANAFEIRYPKNEWSLNKSLCELMERKLISKHHYEELTQWK